MTAVGEQVAGVDGRQLPGLITSGDAYRQWIRYWRNQLNSHLITPLGGREGVPRTSEAFLEALQTSSRGNFILAEGGEILENVPADELSQVADYLYAQLVDTSGGEEPRDLTLDERCDEIISAAQLKTDPNFASRVSVQCLVKGMAEEEYEFSHAYRNGVIQRLYHRVPFSRRRAMLRKTVDAAAWMFEQVTASQIITPDHGGALVLVTAEQQGDPDIRRSVEILGTVTRVLNVADRDTVLSEFQHLPGMAAH